MENSILYSRLLLQLFKESMVDTIGYCKILSINSRAIFSYKILNKGKSYLSDIERIKIKKEIDKEIERLKTISDIILFNPEKENIKGNYDSVIDPWLHQMAKEKYIEFKNKK